MVALCPVDPRGKLTRFIDRCLNLVIFTLYSQISSEYQ